MPQTLAILKCGETEQEDTRDAIDSIALLRDAILAITAEGQREAKIGHLC